MEKEGFDLANELYPDVLGKKIELVYGDNKSDRAEATLAAQSLVDKGVVAVLGSYGSGLSMAGGEVFAENEIPALTATATNPTITLDCEWYARICFIDPFQGTMLARYAVKNEYKKIAIHAARRTANTPSVWSSIFRMRSRRMTDMRSSHCAIS